MSIVLHLSHVWADSLTVLADPPDPGGGTPPSPEVEKGVVTILKWVAWLASAACVGGLILTAGRMALAHRRGDETSVSHLGWVLAACVIVGSASSIVGALL